MQSEGADIDPHDGRDESASERSDRNWNDILQELRVIQTGTQILTGFLLTIPFQERFQTLNATQLTIYLSLVGFAAIATILAIAPVSLHRGLFQRRRKAQLVDVAHVLMRGALLAVGITLTGTTTLIFDVVLGDEAAVAAGVTTAVLTLGAWLALPVIARSRR